MPSRGESKDMPQKLYREWREAAGQMRSLLQELQELGVDELGQVPRPEELPLCPVDKSGGEFCRPETLEEIRTELGDCQRCSLARGRTRLVFGCGSATARLVLVGEGPGREEDLQGIPFVGEAGRLLERMLFAMGLSRDEVYICNVVKCRPPGNRDPAPPEIAACEPFLARQLTAIRPRVILALGRFAAQTLLQDDAPVSRLRGHWRSYQGLPLMPTYHPAFLLRNPAAKREAWEDLKQVMLRLRQGES
jgi:uracil-DNA glycosylase